MPKGRLIGVDLGLKRVGISISDDLGIFAHPLAMIPYSNQSKVLEMCIRDRDDMKPEELRRLGDLLKNKGASIAILGSGKGQRAFLTVMVDEDKMCIRDRFTSLRGKRSHFWC